MRPEDWLKKELKARKKKNRFYSMRALAQHLKVSPATLSGVMQGKRNLSPKFAKKILMQMALPEAVRQRLELKISKKGREEE